MSSEETREFHVADILSVIYARILSPRDVEGVSDILRFLLGRPVSSIEFEPALCTCSEPLFDQHPQLIYAEMPTRSSQKETWIAEQVRRFGETLPVKPLDINF